MYAIREFFETEAKKKDGDYADKVIRHIRVYARPLVSEEEALLGMSYLMNKQGLGFIENLFQNTTQINLNNKNRLFDGHGQPLRPLTPKEHSEFMQKEMVEVRFKPLPILEKVRQIMIAEMKKMGVVVNVRAIDPASNHRRAKDKAIVKNKAQIEKDLSKAYTQIGQPPVKLEDHKARFGERVGNGNIDEFEALGMDANDTADLKMFFDHFHKLLEEMAAQNIIDYSMMFNEVMEKISNWVNDLMAKKAMCAQCYVSEVTGAQMYTYVAPETVWIYGPGRRKDYNDANAKYIQQKVTIKEMLDRIGNAFDFEKEWDRLLMAITFSGNNVEYTDIHPSYRQFVGGQGDNSGKLFKGDSNFSMEDFMALKVTLGYIEWSSQNQEMFGQVKTEGNFYEDNQPLNGERYQTKAKYETPTYKAYFLAISLIDAIIFNFGPQTYQQIEGYSDFNVNYTIVTYKEVGDPLAIQAIPYIDAATEVWYKLMYEIRRSKPRGTDYNYDSLLAIAEDMFMDTNMNKAQKVQKIVEFYDSSANGMYTFPIIDGKPVIMTSGQLNVDKPNGLSPEIMKYWQLYLGFVDEMTAALTGKSPLREGDAPGTRASMNNEFKALEYSQNSTAYIPDSLTYVFQQLAAKTMLFTQDIIQFKDHNTLAYKFLESAVGEESLEVINGLERKAMHRYGIFVESLNQSAYRAKLQARIDFSLQNGKIDDADALLIEDEKNPKKAAILLAYLKRKKEKEAQKNAMEMQKAQAQAAQQAQQGEMAIEKMKIDGDLQGKNMDNQTTLMQHANTNNTQITKQAMKELAELKQGYHDLNADMIRMMAEQGKIPVSPMPGTQPATAPPLPAPSGQNGPAPIQQRPLSGIQQSIQQAQPGNTGMGAV